MTRHCEWCERPIGHDAGDFCSPGCEEAFEEWSAAETVANAADPEFRAALERELARQARERCSQLWPENGEQCVLPIGHDGPHTIERP